MIVCLSKELKLDEELQELINDELNVEELEILHNADEYVSYELKPQLRTVGPKYGKLLGGIKEYLSKENSVEAVNKVRHGESLKFKVNGEAVELTEADLLIGLKNKDGFASETNGDITVVLETKLTEELIEKGTIKEFISKVQNFRKESDFEVVNHIQIEVSGDKKLVDLILKYSDVVKKGTLSDRVKKGANGTHSFNFEVDGKAITVNIERV